MLRKLSDLHMTSKTAKHAHAGGIPMKKAANIFKIPFNTLKVRLKNGTDSNASLSRKCNLPTAHEQPYLKV